MMSSINEFLETQRRTRTQNRDTWVFYTTALRALRAKDCLQSHLLNIMNTNCTHGVPVIKSLVRGYFIREYTGETRRGVTSPVMYAITPKGHKLLEMLEELNEISNNWFLKDERGPI